MKAYLKNYRQSPRKVRLVADLVSGKQVGDAIVSLDLLVKRAGVPIKNLLLSAVANAKAQGADESNLFVKEIRIDKGIVMKRMMPRAMGRGARINKRTSHISLLLNEKIKKTENKEKKEKKTVSKKVTNKKESRKTASSKATSGK